MSDATMTTMPRRYFDFFPDMSVRKRWTLGLFMDAQGRELENAWSFNKGEPVANPGPLKLAVTIPGKPFDLTWGGILTPVVHVRVASVFVELAPDEVQVFPVEVGGQPDQYCVLVATKLIRCIDAAACKEVEYWMPGDGQPDKVGEFRDIYGMRIDSSKAGDAKVFRTWGWPVVMVVREDIKDALEGIGATGIKYQEV